MQYYSTKNKYLNVALREAVLQGLPQDNGLYMPRLIPKLQPDFFQKLAQMSFPEMAYHIAKAFFEEDLPDKTIREIVEGAITFDAPLVELEKNLYCLELFHGPTLAFKDFAARFMARLMGDLIKDSEQKLTILVATSGDTGSAVAHGFYNVPGIDVVVLYPCGKVSSLQEKQMTTLGGNVSALEVAGSFDDCQAMVKQAFLDNDLRKIRPLSSANSINIARLIPQTFYYFRAIAQLQDSSLPTIVSVPSGNFGNLTAGVLATKMGLPIDGFIAATNANDVVPRYLDSGKFQPKPSISTFSNAMDVGNPSNFARMQDIFQKDHAKTIELLQGRAFSDEETLVGQQLLDKRYNYIADPHGAIGYLGLQEILLEGQECNRIFLGTAHPAKFPDVVHRALNREPDIPDRLQVVLNKEGHAEKISADYQQLRGKLLD
ncbi:MAG: threonine synthase [Calditrichia bacterium]